MTPEPPTGASIGPYRILRKLGEGGMGTVYLAHDARLGRDVALKSVLRRGADTATPRERLLREARAAAGLTHPNIAGVYDVVEADGDAYIVMEYVDGESLASRLQHGPMATADITAVGAQLADALAAAHRRGVVHRDLKPGNIQLAPGGAVKVLDFGIARATAPTGSPTIETVAQPVLTTPGAVIGTPAYMSPEQIEGKPVGPPSDIFSLGIVLFEMLTGERPFGGGDPLSLAVAIVSAPTPDVRALAPKAPPALAEVVLAALDKDPAKRPAAAVVHATLAAMTRDSAAGAELPTAAVRQPRIARAARVPRRWLPIVAGAVLAVTVAGWPAVRYLLHRTAPPVPAVVAILPPTYVGDEADLEAVGAGVSSVLAGNLSLIPGVTLVSRASTAPYTGARRQDLLKVGRDLGASFILDLSLRRAATGVRVNAKLWRRSQAASPWTRSYEDDALNVQREVVDGVVAALSEAGAIRTGSLTPAIRARLLRLPTPSSEAFDTYARARSLLDRRDVAGNRERAVILFEAAVAKDPRFALGYAGLTDAYAAMYQATKDVAWVNKAGDAATRALAIDGDQAAVRYSLASLRFATGQPAEAVNQLRLAIALQPENDDAHRLLGRILAEQGKVDEGVAEVRQAIGLRPEYGGHYFMLGFILYNAGRYREALEAYRRVTELQPDFAGGFEMLGTTYHVLGQAQQAIGYYEHAVRLGPSATAYANLGYFYYVGGRFTDALTAYQEALARDPRSPETLRNLGDVYARLGQADRARASYEHAVVLLNQMLQVNRQDASAIALLALLEAKLGHAAQAERHAAEAIVLAPNDSETMVKNAEVAALLGRADAAMEHLAQAVAHGYQAGLLRDNDELATLRSRPDFREMVATRPGGPQSGGVSER